MQMSQETLVLWFHTDNEITVQRGDFLVEVVLNINAEIVSFWH